jgi:hypothetical protein
MKNSVFGVCLMLTVLVTVRTSKARAHPFQYDSETYKLNAMHTWRIGHTDMCGSCAEYTHVRNSKVSNGDYEHVLKSQ